MAELLLHSAPSTGLSVSTLISVDPGSARWEFCSLTVLRITAGTTWRGKTGPDEVALVPLSGSATVTSSSQEWSIGGRSNVFEGPTSSIYLPMGCEYEVRSTDTIELAICGARARRSYPPRFIPADEVAVEIRGAGNAARQINHIVKPDFPADRLLVVEVITPSGNWSSYPPHKHDVNRMPAEADLEEIYYYRIDPPEGFALQRLYTEDGRIDEAWTIRDGDLLLVPEGYHAFAVAHDRFRHLEHHPLESLIERSAVRAAALDAAVACRAVGHDDHRIIRAGVTVDGDAVESGLHRLADTFLQFRQAHRSIGGNEAQHGAHAG